MRVVVDHREARIFERELSPREQPLDEVETLRVLLDHAQLDHHLNLADTDTELL